MVKIAFSERYKDKIEDFSQKKGRYQGPYQVVTDPCCSLSVNLLRFHLASDWSRNNKHSRNFPWCSWFYGTDCKDGENWRIPGLSLETVIGV